MSRSPVELVNALNINWLRRTGRLGAGWQSSVSWQYGGEPCGSIQFECKSLYEASLDYSYNGERINQPVTIEWTHCHFGGMRPWFICSAWRRGQYCGRRVGKLYGAGKIFACRHCYRLCYRSQLEDTKSRAIGLTHKLWARLDDDGKKPKGMHWRTYNRLCERIDRAEAISWGYLAQAMQRYM